MKGFLIDENLPIDLPLVSHLPIYHSRDLGLSVKDGVIWNYAKVNELVIITRDSDFSYRIQVSQPPPWVIHYLEFERLWPHVEPAPSRL